MKFKNLSIVSLFVLISLIVVSGVFFKTNTALAVCNLGPGSNDVPRSPIISSIIAPTGIYTAGSIPITISGTGGYFCEGDPSAGSSGADNVKTVVSYVIKNSAGVVKYDSSAFGSWETTACNLTSSICGPRSINVNQTIDGSTWATGTYTIDVLAKITSLTTEESLTDTKSGTFNIVGPSGTINATDCVITVASGYTTCDSTVDWRTRDLISGADTEVTHNNPDHAHVSDQTSSDPTPVTIHHGKTIFFIYHNINGTPTKIAESVPINATCPDENLDTGMHWNGSQCSFAPVPFGIISASDCAITSGTTCTTTVHWEITNPMAGAVTAVTHNNPDNSPVSDQISGTQDFNISSTTTFFLYHNHLIKDPCADCLAKATATVTSTVPKDRSWGWGDWGACINGRQTRAAICTPPVNGGLACETTPPAPYNNPQSKICGGGACSVPPDHITRCSDGIPGTVTNSISKWTWTCGPRIDGAPAVTCNELKKKPIIHEI